MKWDLDHHDPDCQVLIAIMARKAGASCHGL